MNKRRNFFAKLQWIRTVSGRFARVDRKGRSAVTSVLATLGICFGVMTLITVMSIMNGFQMNFIDAIMEVSSYHIRGSGVTEEKEADFINTCLANKNVISITPFYEAQTLMTNEKGHESAAIIRAVEPDIYEKDAGFSHEMEMIGGKFDLSQSNSIVLGYTLARKLRVEVGETVNLLVLSGGSDVSLLSGDRNFIVKGLFKTGYSDINSSYCFINLQDGKDNFGKAAEKLYGIKLKDSQDDAITISSINKAFEDAQLQSWRDYNKSFFGALRIEKNMLLLLVALIFVVVGVNIYNGMRRLVFERKSVLYKDFSFLESDGSELFSVCSMKWPLFIVRIGDKAYEFEACDWMFNDAGPFKGDNKVVSSFKSDASESD